jgi:flavin-dependent dehydrogenase
MMTETDVLIVGASLAGLCVARAAASGGARTLLVDAAPVLGNRPNPATLLTELLWRRTGLPLVEEAVEREFSGLKLGGPSGSARSSGCVPSTWTAGSSTEASPSGPGRHERRF